MAQFVARGSRGRRGVSILRCIDNGNTPDALNEEPTMTAIARRLTPLTMIAAALAAVFIAQLAHAAPSASAVRVIQLPTVVVTAKRIPVVQLPQVVITARRIAPAPTELAQRAARSAPMAASGRG